MNPRRKPVQREKHEQAAIVQLLRSIGAKVYVLGTRRPRGDYHGTCQTPGIPDLYVFMPPHAPNNVGGCAMWIEVKAHGGRLSEEQRQFAFACMTTGTSQIIGGLDVVIQWLIEKGYLRPQQVPHYRLKETYAQAKDSDERRARGVKTPA